MSILDTLGRPLANLRLSVTDRCNLRCQYCMPENEYIWLERDEILSFEEISRLVDVFTALGVTRIRLTGGEPLLRRDLDRLIRLLASKPQIRDLALTTNGFLLGAQARGLRAAGLHRLTVSLDTLRPERFLKLVRRDALPQVLAGIRAAGEAGLRSLKLNAVVVRGFNEDELAELVDYARGVHAEVRFIEYMDVGGATRWSMGQVFPRAEMLATLERRFGPIRPLGAPPVTMGGDTLRSAAPAARFVLPDGSMFGIISATTQPFCDFCNRARLTPDGMLLVCLYARQGIDLKEPLRRGVPPEEIAEAIKHVWRARADRGAEERQLLPARTPLFRLEDLRKNPHLEMHTRGG